MAVKKRGKSYLVVVNYRQSDGTRAQLRRTAANLAAAKILEAELLSKRDTGIPLKPEKMTVGAYLTQWLASRDGSIRETTARRYDGLLDHVSRDVGGVLLQRLTPLQIAGVYGLLRKRGLSPKTVLNVHRVLSKALKDAARMDLISRNPIEKIESPRAPKYEPRILTSGELAKILEVANGTPYAPLIRLGAWTGLRLGEALALQWLDVDLAAGRLRVRRTVSPDGKIGSPKTRQSARTLSLSHDLVEVLREQHRLQAEEKLRTGPAYADGDLVVANALGNPLSHGKVDHAWKRLVEKAGVEHVRFHDLRHFHATTLLAAGVPIPVLSERLGHSERSTTLNVYSHAVAGGDEAAASVMDRVMSGVSQK